MVTRQIQQKQGAAAKRTAVVEPTAAAAVNIKDDFWSTVHAAAKQVRHHRARSPRLDRRPPSRHQPPENRGSRSLRLDRRPPSRHQHPENRGSRSPRLDRRPPSRHQPPENRGSRSPRLDRRPPSRHQPPENRGSLIQPHHRSLLKKLTEACDRALRLMPAHTTASPTDFLSNCPICYSTMVMSRGGGAGTGLPRLDTACLCYKQDNMKACAMKSEKGLRNVIKGWLPGPYAPLRTTLRLANDAQQTFIIRIHKLRDAMVTQDGEVVRIAIDLENLKTDEPDKPNYDWNVCPLRPDCPSMKGHIKQHLFTGALRNHPVYAAVNSRQLPLRRAERPTDVVSVFFGNSRVTAMHYGHGRMADHV
ncbi:Translation initiation factor IF-2 [Frankliniella fusca]|uniref:Translation initiation factor IF-2 n=1 Tax=Frankliniella fusca TaxID=407009 RepID=A0AAE1HEP7_9NEOP|nr:Translation initiation factor IF-2 [Frankliniella fusca]